MLLLNLPAFALTNQNEAKKETILFVCGGNTGRSVLAEWYTRSKYHKRFNTFSRGSGIDPEDEITIEPPAAKLLIKNHVATAQQLSLQRATPINITDIYNSDAVLVMTLEYKDRLFNLIETECEPNHLVMRNLSLNRKKLWDTMCSERGALKSKIHTLHACASGDETSEVPNANGSPDSFYIPVYDSITKNIKLIMANAQNNHIVCIK